MKRSILYVLLAASAVSACAARTPGGSGVAPDGADRTKWEGDPRLYGMLMSFPLSAADADSIAVYTREFGGLANNMLGQAAEDPYAPSAVRANALFVLSQRRASAELPVFRNALDDEDVRVRATAIAAMREFYDVRPVDAMRLARLALQDPAPEVQAQALPIIGERDVELIRSYAARTTDAELRLVAEGLIAVAEERGAPLSGDSATGVLSRVTSSGRTLTFTPTKRWPQWNAAVGAVRVEGAGAQPIVLENIEVVNNVVPVFFSPEGTHLVFERARQVVVRDIATGSERIIGDGIAPRVRSFTNDFVFLREVVSDRVEERERTRLRYDVMNASFDGDRAPVRLGAVGAFTNYGVAGGYSPARWMRVEDRVGNYYLIADELEVYALPDPFGAGVRGQ